MNTPGRFRHRPSVIEAMRVDGSVQARSDVIAWILNNGGRAQLGGAGNVLLDTVLGRVSASSGDWILRGVDGFAVCDRDVFEHDYEAVNG